MLTAGPHQDRRLLREELRVLHIWLSLLPDWSDQEARRKGYAFLPPRESEGSVKDPCSVEQLKEEYDAILRQHERGNEASTAHFNYLLESFWQKLASREGSDAIEELKADVAFRARHYDEAFAYYQDLLDQGGSDSTVLVRVVKCACALGRDEDALRYIEVAKKQHGHDERIMKRLAPFESRFDAARATVQVQEALQKVLAEPGQMSQSEFVGVYLEALKLVGLVDGSGDIEGFLRAYYSFAASDYSWVETPSGSEGQIDESKSGPRMVFCAGFGWSGSGAVFDFLRQFDGVSVFSTEEMVLFANNRQDVDLSDLVMAEREPKRSIVKLIVQWLSIGLFGFSQGQVSAISAEKNIKRALIRSDTSVHRKHSILNAFKDFLFSLSMADKSGDLETELVPCLRSLFRKLCNAIDNEAEVLLFSNAISPSRVAALKTLPHDSSLVAVFRDVRDAYSERYLAGKRWDPETFIRSYRAKISAYRKGCSMLEGHGSVREVWFEDLVNSSSMRDELARSILGVDGIPKVIRSTFSPEKSEKNIGKHIRFDDQSAIQEIGEALGEFVRS